MVLKKLIFLFIIFLSQPVFSQKDSSAKKKADSGKVGLNLSLKKDSIKRKDSLKPSHQVPLVKIDTINSFDTQIIHEPLLRKSSLKIQNKTLNPGILHPGHPELSEVPASIQSKKIIDSSQTASIKEVPQLTWNEDTAFSRFFKSGNITGNSIYQIDELKTPSSKDEIFYIILGMVFFLSFIKISFPKYFKNLLPLFFQIFSGHRHSKENMHNDPLPSLLLNLLFVYSAAVFISLISQQYNPMGMPFWKLLLYAIVLIAGIYLFKFLFIRFLGWVFNAAEATSTYLFVVFLINKILGIILTPLVFLLAFSNSSASPIIITVTISLLLLFLIYRFAVSLIIIRRNLNVSPLHFFIYLCAVEVVPLLLIYRLILNEM